MQFNLKNFKFQLACIWALTILLLSYKNCNSNRITNSIDMEFRDFYFQVNLFKIMCDIFMSPKINPIIVSMENFII